MEKMKQAVLVPQDRYEELLWKEHIYDLKHEELTRAGYVTDFDSILFGIPAGPSHTECHCEDCNKCDNCGKVAAGA